jgi:hypothetical protein
MTQFVPGVRHGLVPSEDDTVGTGVLMGCYTCRQLIKPLPHRSLPGLQWTCGCGWTWGPVDWGDMTAWQKWVSAGCRGAPFWLLREPYAIPKDHLAMVERPANRWSFWRRRL